jgi:predicted RNA polymerase sigma factor
VIDASGDTATYQQYATLFTYAFAAGQTRKADLAYNKALDLAPSKDSRAAIKAQMDSVKNQSSGTSTTPTTTDSATGE